MCVCVCVCVCVSAAAPAHPHATPDSEPGLLTVPEIPVITPTEDETDESIEDEVMKAQHQLLAAIRCRDFDHYQLVYSTNHVAHLTSSHLLSLADNFVMIAYCHSQRRQVTNY